jgi:transposase
MKKMSIVRRTKEYSKKEMRERMIWYCTRSTRFHKKRILNWVSSKMGTIPFKKRALSYKKTEKTPWNHPSEAIQEDFEVMYKIYEEQAEKWDIHLLFYDPNHQIHNSINWKRRQKQWRDGTLKIKSNTGRRRINILWWVDVITHQFVWTITEENCNIKTTKETLMKIRNFYRNQKKIVIILDNARYQRAYDVQFFAKKLWIELLFLPAYSPNLNLIERVWKYFKAKVFKNMYYATFTEFISQIHHFFDTFILHREKVSNLVNWKFQIIKCV